MGGSLTGHGAAWPLPHIINNAIHAALHRAELKGVHAHRQDVRNGRSFTDNRPRRFGSVVSAGPYPVRTGQAGEQWFFARPADAQQGGATAITLIPVFARAPGLSSLPKPLLYSVGNCNPPSKAAKVESWLSTKAFENYLKSADVPLNPGEFSFDTDISDTEHQIGIGISPDTGAQNGEQFYSAHYLRIRDHWRLGILASGQDKELSANSGDLIATLLSDKQQIVVGGQQRICTAARSAGAKTAPLPRGLSKGFSQRDGRYLVKWVLLSPAIWPEIGGQSKDKRSMTGHPGGWLPNWISEKDGAVLLRSVNSEERRRRRGLRASGKGYASNENSGEIRAQLVAAIIPKAVTVSGWSLGDPSLGDDGQAGAKPAHLAVPAGAVYYFETESAEDAETLADALNWHGPADGRVICNRRSTLMGEKGFGLGVCGSWNFIPLSNQQ